MLNYRRQERKQKSISEGAEKPSADFPVNHSFPKGKKDEDELLRQNVADDRMNSALPTTTANLLPKEITAVEPFNAFPIKIEPYMLDLLLSCECLPTSPLRHFLQPSFFISSKRG
jgi:hypothetical protein